MKEAMMTKKVIQLREIVVDKLNAATEAEATALTALIDNLAGPALGLIGG
jgi:hypothetical protein